MPAVSKAQLRFMQAIAHGAKLGKGHGLSKEEAREFVKHQSGKGLPERKGTKRGFARMEER